MDNSAHLEDSILYYPSIEFHDEAWLKSALCIWERVYRIVPASYTPKDSDDVKRAIDSDLVRDINLSKEELSECAQHFTGFMDSVEVQPAGLEGFDDSEYRLHPEKVDAKLRPLFESLADRIDSDGFLNLSREVAHGYMLFLAETVSRRRRIPKLTDSPEVFAVMEYFANDGRIEEFVYDFEAKEYAVALAVPNILPDMIEYADMKDVLKLRKQTLKSRKAFRETVGSFVNRLSQIEESSQVENAVRDFKTGLQSSYDATTITYKDFVKNLVTATITVGIPTSIVAILALTAGGNPFSSVDLGDIGCICAISALTSAIRETKRTPRSNTTSYFMELSKTFGPMDVSSVRMHPFDRHMEEFIND